MPEAEEPDRSELSFSWSSVRGHLAPFEICRTAARNFFPGRNAFLPDSRFFKYIFVLAIFLKYTTDLNISKNSFELNISKNSLEPPK
jgi:hypothetical protein